jgi:hypothetical protein
MRRNRRDAATGPRVGLSKGGRPRSKHPSPRAAGGYRGAKHSGGSRRAVRSVRGRLFSLGGCGGCAWRCGRRGGRCGNSSGGAGSCPRGTSNSLGGTRFFPGGCSRRHWRTRFFRNRCGIFHGGSCFCASRSGIFRSGTRFSHGGMRFFHGGTRFLVGGAGFFLRGCRFLHGGMLWRYSQTACFQRLTRRRFRGSAFRKRLQAVDRWLALRGFGGRGFSLKNERIHRSAKRQTQGLSARSPAARFGTDFCMRSS